MGQNGSSGPGGNSSLPPGAVNFGGGMGSSNSSGGGYQNPNAPRPFPSGGVTTTATGDPMNTTTGGGTSNNPPAPPWGNWQPPPFHGQTPYRPFNSMNGPYANPFAYNAANLTSSGWRPHDGGGPAPSPPFNQGGPHGGPMPPVGDPNPPMMPPTPRDNMHTGGNPMMQIMRHLGNNPQVMHQLRQLMGNMPGMRFL